MNKRSWFQVAADVADMEAERKRKERRYLIFGSLILAVTAAVVLILAGIVMQPPLPAEDDGTRTFGDWVCVPAEDGTWQIKNYTAKTRDITVPAELGGKGGMKPVTRIGSAAFAGRDTTRSITLPDSVTVIDGNPFDGCTSLRAVNVSEGHPRFVTVEGVLFERTDGGMVLRCYPDALPGESYTVPAAVDGLPVTAVGTRAFGGTCDYLTAVILPEGLIRIGEDAFADFRNLHGVSLPDSLQTVGAGAFNRCVGLNRVGLPAGLRVVGEDAFRDCAGLQVTALPEGLQWVGDRAFMGCDKVSLTALPASLTNIGAQAFARCDLSGVEALPEGLTHLGSGAFERACLRRLRLPAGLTDIAEGAFSGCPGLVLEALPGTPAAAFCEKYRLAFETAEAE